MKILSIFSLFLFINISYAKDTDLSQPHIPSTTFSSQLELDAFVARRALQLFAEMNTSSRFQFPEPGKASQTNSLLWQEATEMSPLNQGLQSHFKLKPGIKPSEGLKDLFKEGAILECLLARNLIIYIILCELLGDDFFDNGYSSNFRLLDRGIPILGIDHNKNTPTTPGQIGYITNIHEYIKMHPIGPAAGQNIFCVGTDEEDHPLYFGFGALFKTGPKTLYEIETYLYSHTIRPSENVDVNPIISLFEENYRLWELGRKQAQNSFQSYYFDVNELNQLLTIRPGPFAFTPYNAYTYEPNESDEEFFTQIETQFLENPMVSDHKALVQKLFENKTPEQRAQYAQLVESVLTAKIHPYEFYQFLLLIDHFPSFAEAQEAFAKVDTADTNNSVYKFASKLGLGFKGQLSTEVVIQMPRPQAKELPRIQVFEQHYMDITNSKLNILFPEFSTLELGNTSGKTPVTDSPDFVESVAVLQSK